MFNLYRKVHDCESDSEERQSLKAETTRPDEPEDPRFLPVAQPQKPRVASSPSTSGQHVPSPGQGKWAGQKPAAPAAQEVQFHPFSQSTTSSREPPAAASSSTAHTAQGPATMPPPPLHASASAPFLHPVSASTAPNLATHSFCDLLGDDTDSLPAAAPVPTPNHTAMPGVEAAGPTAAAAASSDPCFIRESDWALLASSPLPPPTAPAAGAAAASGSAEPLAASQGWAQLEDLFEGVEGASAPMPASASAAAMQAGSRGDGAAPPGGDTPDQRTDSGPMGEAPGQFIEPRELLIYAIPLIKDRLVFLPVTAWQMDPEVDKQGFSGAVKSGFSRVTGSVSNWWSSLKEKDPDSLGHKVHHHGTSIMENMTAEERLMQNIPRNAQKLVIHHPASIDPSEVQEQLSKMTSTYCMKSLGKAAVAGVILPVAVGLEILAVPGAGWIALYHLYKSSASAAGGQRLKSYLNKGNDVRVNFAGDPRLDKYVERVDNSSGGVLGDDDIEELCHDVQESSLNHPLTELRNRFIRRHINHKSDYAQLPDSDAGPQEPESLFLGKASEEGAAAGGKPVQ